MTRPASLRSALLLVGAVGLLAAAPAFAQTGAVTRAPRSTAKAGKVVETLPAARAKARTRGTAAARAPTPRPAVAPAPRMSDGAPALEIESIKA